jgi:CMP-N-acetylneuraminic acid synthetase
LIGYGLGCVASNDTVGPFWKGEEHTMRTVAFIPIKLNNERLPGKNTRQFFDGTPLMHFVQKTLLHAKTVNEIYVYCSDESVTEYLLPSVKFLQRPKRLDGNLIKGGDIISEFLKAINADIYVVSHATSPFFRSDCIDICVNKVLYEGFDSAFMARRYQRFLWRDGEALNFDPVNIPRTQELPLIYEELTGAYVFPKETFLSLRRRVGERPYIHEIGEIEAWDIDYPEDFEVANAIYKEIIRKRK